MTRDELVEALRLHGPEIIEADEWRPLAGHVLELVEHGLLRPTPPSGAEIEAARGFLSTMLQNDPTERVVLAALDALAREPGIKELFVAAMDDKVQNEDRIAALEAKLARVRRLCAGIDDPALIDFAHDVLDALDDKPADPEE